jgi:hypothetical protein
VPVRTYQLTVKGELSDPSSGAFEGMKMIRAHGTTTLVGPVRDQAELQGLLFRIADLGLTLLSAESIGEGDPTS